MTFPPKITDKRTAILDATLDLIAERGFHNTPMSLVARRSGVSTGIIYHYFENKDALITELYKAIKHGLFSAILAEYDESVPHRERFLDLWGRSVSYFTSHPKEIQFLEQFENSPYYDEQTAALFDEHMAPIFAFFHDGIAQGILKDIDFAIILEMSVGVATSLAKQHIRGALQLDEGLIAQAAQASWDAVAV